MQIDSLPIRFKITPKKIFFILFANVLIALFIVAIFPGSNFTSSLIFSQCIGISEAACVILAVDYLKTNKFGIQILYIILAVVVGAVVGIVSGSTILKFLFPGSMPSLPESEKYNNIVANLLYALLFGAFMTYIFISLQKLSDEKIKRLEVERNAAVTEIRLLQSQMEPHFLFNTLSTILSLIDGDPEKAKRMLESFTAFLRASLLVARKETITLEQELDVVRNYLEIFRIRMGDRLRYSLEIDESLRCIQVPPLLIQPLVENGIKHGLEPSVRGGELRVLADRNGQHARIIVADSGPGITEMSPGNGIGVDNIKKRLRLLYGEQAHLRFEENMPSGVRAVIDIPYEKCTGNHSRR